MILNRDYCAYKHSLAQLSADIEFIYMDLSSNYEYSMSPYELAVMQEKIVSGLYVLSPLKVKFIFKFDLSKFLLDTLSDCPDIMLGTCSALIQIRFVWFILYPDKKDVLVLMGLSLLLFRLSYGSLLKDGYRFSNQIDKFYYSLQQILCKSSFSILLLEPMNSNGA